MSPTASATYPTAPSRSRTDGSPGWERARSWQALPNWSAADVTDAQGLWITPGLIECHTHLVYAGDRSNEFEARLRGATYEEIARAGGGIVSTMRATRAADRRTSCWHSPCRAHRR